MTKDIQIEDLDAALKTVAENRSTLENFGVPTGKNTGRGGILMPLQRYRFRAIANNCSPGVIDAFAQQVSNARIDFVKRTISIEVRMTVAKESFDAVLAVTSTGLAPTIEALDGGDDGVLFRLYASGAKLTKHEVVFDYADSSYVIHDLEWSFTSCNLRP